MVAALENTYGTVNEDGERTGLKRKEESSTLSVCSDDAFGIHTTHCLNAPTNVQNPLYDT